MGLLRLIFKEKFQLTYSLSRTYNSQTREKVEKKDIEGYRKDIAKLEKRKKRKK